MQAIAAEREQDAKKEQETLLRQVQDDKERLKQNEKSASTTSSNIFGHALVPVISLSAVYIHGQPSPQPASLLRGPNLGLQEIGSFFSADLTTKGSDDDTRLPVTLQLVDFATRSHYYTSNAGRAKITDLKNELHKVQSLPPSSSLLAVYGVETSDEAMAIVTAPLSANSLLSAYTLLGLQFNIEQILDILLGICRGLYDLHQANLTHKSVSCDHIVIKRKDGGGLESTLLGSSYLQLLTDMNRSIPFCQSNAQPVLPSSW